MANGLFTFLLTDVEGSTALWERDARSMEKALEAHDRIIRACVEENGGELVKSRGEGDSHFCVFASPSGALAAATGIQRAFSKETWSTPEPLRVRIAVHTGEIQLRDGEYYGVAVNKAARLRSIAHGGQIVVSLVAREIAYNSLPEECSLLDLGEQRLKDLMRAERVFQVVGPDLVRDFPPLRSLRPERNNLPLQLTSFVGREEEIREVSRKCMRSRLVTLVGPGGSGKTRLALQVAADLADEFEGGVWFIDLTSVSQPEAVPSVAARTLRAPDTPGKSPLDAICESLPDRPTLIVIDNCEHLGTAPGQLADALMRRLSFVTLIATSRRPMNLSGEATHLVRPLEVPLLSEAGDLESLKSSESVRLMLDRAEARAPNFKLTTSNAYSFAALCRDLEGIPLAIELAASKLRMLSVDQLLARLKQSLDLLKGGVEDTDERHRTLRATIDWSYRQLRPAEQEMLVRLSVFPAGCTLEAAEKVCEVDGIEASEVLDSIEHLVTNSLVQSEQGRYRILETIRQFAEDVASKELLVRASEGLYEWALDLATRTKPLLLGEQQDYWLAELDAEYPNLRSALEATERYEAEENRLGLLAANLDRFWHRRGMIREGRSWLSAAIECAGELDELTKATLIRSLGTFAYYQKDLDVAESLLNQSAEAFRKAGNRSGLAGALTNLAIIASEKSDWESAKRYHLEGLELTLADGNRQAIAHSLINLGATEQNAGRNSDAAIHYEQAIPYARVANDKVLLCQALTNLAGCVNDPARSASCLSDALDLASELSEVLSVQHVLMRSATLAFTLDQPETSLRLLCYSEDLVRLEGVLPHHEEIEYQEVLRSKLRDKLGASFSDISGLTLPSRHEMIEFASFFVRSVQRKGKRQSIIR